MYKYVWYCRWDGKTYRPPHETDRDGFCCPACKQAHHRAIKKYVTAKAWSRANPQGPAVTPKKSKKKGCPHDKKTKEKSR